MPLGEDHILYITTEVEADDRGIIDKIKLAEAAALDKNVGLSLVLSLDKDATYWINKFNLKEHPEGGYFVETYISDKLVTLPSFDGPRYACTAIYYLLLGEQFSSFHTMKSDELWHFCAGSTLTLHIIGDDDGELHEIQLGNNIDNGEKL